MFFMCVMHVPCSIQAYRSIHDSPPSCGQTPVARRGPPQPLPPGGRGVCSGPAISDGQVGGRLRSSSLLSRRGAGPFSARILRGRGHASAPARFAHLIARARQRAHLSRRLLTGFQKLAPPGRAAPGKRLRMPLPSGHGSTIRQISSPKPEIFHGARTNFRRHPASGPLLTAPGRAPCPRRLPVRRSGLRRWAARRSSGRDIA